MMNGLFSFDGRINRLTWWGYQLLLLLVLGVALGPLLLIGNSGILIAVTILWMIILLVVAGWSGYAVGAKRLHDMGRSGWWILLHLIPTIGPFIILVWLGFFPGDQIRNEYGPEPGQEDNEEGESLADIMKRHNEGS